MHYVKYYFNESLNYKEQSTMTQIKKQERNKLYFTLLMDGVVTVKQEYWGTHAETGLDNLKVRMIMKNLTSNGHVDYVFNWLAK